MSISFQKQQEIEQACTKLVNQFSNYNDQSDYESLCGLFADNAAFARPTDPENFTTGREAILAAFRSRPNDRITRHLISNIIIDVIDENTAKGICYATLFMAPADAEPAKFGVKANPSQLLGEFYIDFQMSDSGWKISRQSGKIIFST